MLLSKNILIPSIQLVAMGFFLLRTTFAQGVFAGYEEKPAFYSNVLSSLEQQYKKDIAGLPAKDKKDIEKIYGKRWDNIQEKIDKKEIYGNPSAQGYLDEILSVITAANPQLKDLDIQCYFSRSGIPNASYLGEGLILFNMGLFIRLKNESQAAFVLCHELAHLCLQHSENSILRYVSTLNSEETQKELRNIKKTSYGKRQELEKLLKGITFDTRRHGRNHESSADSMAVELLRNTRFNISESLTTLALLDSVDLDTTDMASVLKELFDHPDYPFREKWISKEEGLLGGHSKLAFDTIIVDSLKTHPDCNERMQSLIPLTDKYKQVTVARENLIDTQSFNQLKKLFEYEIIDYAFTSGNYSNSLFYAVNLLKQKPGDPYLVTQTGKIFLGLYNAQDKHILGKVTDQPAPFNTAPKNLLLQFIQNLYKNDYIALGYYFMKQHRAAAERHPSFEETFNGISRLYKQ